METTKICIKCNYEKDLDLFLKRNDCKGGRRNVCKACSYSAREKHKHKYKYKYEYKYVDKKESARKWYQRNKEYQKAKTKEYRNSEKGKIIKRLSNAKRRLLIETTDDGTICSETLSKLLKEQDNKCYYCHGVLDLNIKNNTHLDHVIPLSKGGSHTIDNVVWSCKTCNLNKSDKIL